MTQKAEDLMMNAPAPATPKQLRELSIRVVDGPQAGGAKPAVQVVAPDAG
jgi:aspartyl-tRNA synthetase